MTNPDSPSLLRAELLSERENLANYKAALALARSDLAEARQEIADAWDCAKALLVRALAAEQQARDALDALAKAEHEIAALRARVAQLAHDNADLARAPQGDQRDASARATLARLPIINDPVISEAMRDLEESQEWSLPTNTTREETL